MARGRGRENTWSSGGKKPRSRAQRERDFRRLLSRSTLDDDMRASIEEKLKVLVAEREVIKAKELERKNAVKYRRIKFFERRKLMRRINHTRRALRAAMGEEGTEAAAGGNDSASDSGSDAQSATEKDPEALQAKLLELRRDYAYTKYFPKALPYISLFPPEPLADDRAAEQARIRGELAEARVDEIAVGFDFEQEGYKKAPRKDSARGGGAGRRNNDRHAASDRRGNSEGGTRTERRRRQARSTDTADDAFFLTNGVAPVVEYGRRATQDRPRGKFSTPRPAAARQSEPEERSATKPVARRGDGGSGRKRGADKAGHPEDDDPMAKKQKVTGKLDSIDLSARASGAMVFGDSDSDSS